MIHWLNGLPPLSNSKTFFCKDVHIPLGVALCPIPGEHKPMQGITACWLIHHTKCHVEALSCNYSVSGLHPWWQSSCLAVMPQHGPEREPHVGGDQQGGGRGTQLSGLLQNSYNGSQQLQHLWRWWRKDIQPGNKQWGRLMLLFWHDNMILTRFFSYFLPWADATLRWMAQYEQQTDDSEQIQADTVKFSPPLMPCALVICNGLVGAVWYTMNCVLCWCILIHQCISWISFLVDHRWRSLTCGADCWGEHRFKWCTDCSQSHVLHGCSPCRETP